MRDFRVLAINPGSTSTKVGLFEGEKVVFTKTVAHDTSCLAEFATISDQLSYRYDAINTVLVENGVDLASIDAFVGRGGGLQPVEGGTYNINDVILDHARRGANGIQHPAQLGSQLAHAFSQQVGGRPEYVVNPPDTDELCDEARITGMHGVYRHVHLHALNLKETAIRHAARIGRRYEECNFVVCHIGGGISVSAHQGGMMIDGNDIVGGEGPLTPTRCGSIPVAEVLNLIQSGSETGDIRWRCMKNGGFMDLLGTNDAQEVETRMQAGDAAAARAWNAMVYQICKWIGAMACVLHGKVDGVLLGGGMVHSAALVDAISERCSWIAPVTAYPGEFELQAMAAGALRVLSGQEQAKIYTGKPRFEGFE